MIMPLDNISGHGITKKDPKDYSVVFLSPERNTLERKIELTLTEAIKFRDTFQKGMAVIVRTAATVWSHEE